MAKSGATHGLRPTQFQPTEQPTRLKLPLPSWWQSLLVVFILCVSVVAWFLFTATAVRFTANTEPMNVDIAGGIAIQSGSSYLMPPGQYEVVANADGYKPIRQSVQVLAQSDQLVELEFTPLPGVIYITGNPVGASVDLGSEHLGVAPLTTELPSGTVQLSVRADSYQSTEISADITGRQVEQTITYELRPNWAEVLLPTSPSGAKVLIDDQETPYQTPGPIRVMAGEREITVKIPGYEAWTDILFVEPEQTIELELVTLKLSKGTLYLKSTPSDASVTINGQFTGTTPLEVALAPRVNHRIETSLFGYQKNIRNIKLEPLQTRQIHLKLQEVTGKLAVTTDPEHVEIRVDGKVVGTSNTILELHATDHDIELRKEGYAGYATQITVQSDFQQELKVRLLTLEEARLASLEQARMTSENQALVLLKPSSIIMGASRRQPGRRANEVFRSVDLDRLVYISKYEVTNAEFRRFASGHDSGEFENSTLNKDDQPVVNVSWREAAQYCNWLSTKEGYEPFYTLRTGDPPKYDANSLGYRLPTEAEWSWAARSTGTKDELLLFPWGDSLPPPNHHGNYADRAAQHVIGRVIFNYNDNHTVASPVGTFNANYHGLNDMGGNVAEWVHNFYNVPEVNAVLPNLGPDSGEYHVIRGSSWMHGTITDLRLSFRDYGSDGRRDVGFRLARFAE